MIFAYYRHGILTSHKVENGKTINGKYYEEYIKTLRQAIRRKRPELLAAGPIILGDVIARAIRVGNVGPPLYSPDTSPCD